MGHSFIQYIGLLLIIVMLVMLANKIRVAYPIVLLAGGVALSFVPGIPKIVIDPELIFMVFLPPLLYDAAWQTSWKEFWKWRRIIGSFAFLIVIVTALVIAVVSSRLIPGFTLAFGFLLGGIVSPPDAVSATSIMRTISVPKRVRTILEGESLLNDAASLLVFRFSLLAITTGSFVFRHAATDFFLVVVMGAATGLAIALIFYAIHRWLPTTTNSDILLSVVAPYLMYTAAEYFHFSGVLAVVCGGLFLSERSQTILQYKSRLRSGHVWSTLAFALNGFIFLLIGLQLPLIVRGLETIGLRTAIFWGLAISGTLIVLRILCTLGASAFTVFISRFITTADPNPGWKGPVLLGWAGMRGVVSLAAALSIPLTTSSGQPFPFRNLILFITFCVILVTLVLQGLTLPVLVRWLNMEDPDYPLSTKQQEMLMRREMSAAALGALKKKYSGRYVDNPWLQNLESRYQNDLDMLETRANEKQVENKLIHYKNYRTVVLDLLETQRTLLQGLNKRQDIDEEIIKKFHTLLDMEEEKIRRQFAAEHH